MVAHAFLTVWVLRRIKRVLVDMNVSITPFKLSRVSSLSPYRMCVCVCVSYLTWSFHRSHFLLQVVLINKNVLIFVLFMPWQKVIKEMNRLGMVVDLSHVSVQTMRDTLNATKAPVSTFYIHTRHTCVVTFNTFCVFLVFFIIRVLLTPWKQTVSGDGWILFVK